MTVRLPQLKNNLICNIQNARTWSQSATRSTIIDFLITYLLKWVCKVHESSKPKCQNAFYYVYAYPAFTLLGVRYEYDAAKIHYIYYISLLSLLISINIVVICVYNLNIG